MPLSAELIAECRDNFNLFDRDGDGRVSEKELCTLLCSVGFSPTQADIKDLTAQFCKSPEGFDLETFTKITESQQKRTISDGDIVNALAPYSKSGMISSAELRYLLTTMGDKLSEEEVDEILREADIEATGQLNCADFVKMLASSK
ncbi:calmodulin [Planoprotostelium fungivorum]|uniref:Calmodulin n=1 Tax=Planoprotostelium fungivorum TaxID=1890364 RepID=A0A2P6NBG7_9EUKA|nr:calmodulin [Planoprotostelium fungivorum]